MQARYLNPHELDQLENRRGNRATCPLCADHLGKTNPSLVIFDDRGCYCHRCQATTKQILVALGRPERDFSADSQANTPHFTPLPPKKATDPPSLWNHRRDRYIIAIFEFETVEGVRVQHVKFPTSDTYPKWSWRFMKHGLWYNRIGGNTPYLFNRADVAAADIVYLVEGEKDAERGKREAGSLKNIAFTTTHAGANSALKPHQLEQLRGKTVYLIGDNDEAGRNGVIKKFKQLANEGIDCQIVHLPVTQIGADLSDYFDSGATFADLQACPIEQSAQTVVVPEGAYLSDVPFDLPARAILTAATGIGKTTYALGLEGRTIFACPTQTLVQQLAADYPHADLYYEHAKTAHVDSQLIICTYDSVPAVMQFCADFSDWNLVIDEIHNSAASGDYRHIALDNLLDTLTANWQKIVVLTGTPFPLSNPTLISFSSVNVESTLRTQSAQLISWDTKTKKRDALRSQCDPDQRHLIFLNDKRTELDSVMTLLCANGFTSDQIMTLNADNKRLPEQANLIATGIVPDTIRVLLVTSVAIEGISLYSDFDCIHVYSRLHPLLAQQLVSRLRNNAAHAYIYCNGVGKNETVNEQKWLDRTLADAQSLLEKTIHNAPDPNDDSEEAAISRRSISIFLGRYANLIRTRNDSDVGRFFAAKSYDLSYSGIDNATFTSVMHYTYDNPAIFQTMLCPFGWVFGDKIELTKTSETPLEAENRAALKAQRQAEHIARCDTLRQLPTLEVELIAKQGSDTYDKPMVETAKQVVGISAEIHHDIPQAIDIVEQKSTNRALKREVKRIHIQQAREAGEEITTALYSGLSIGDVLTADEIHVYMSDTFSQHGVLNWLVKDEARLTKTRCTRLLRDLFTLKRVQIREAGKRINAYKILDDNPCITYTVKKQNIVSDVERVSAPFC